MSPNRQTGETNIKNKDRKPDTLTSIERVIGMIWNDQELIKLVKSDLIADSEKEYIKKILKQINLGSIIKSEFSPEEMNELDQISFVAMKDFDSNKENLKEELLYLVKRIEGDSREDIRIDFARKIAEAEKSGDQKKLKKLVEEFQALIK